MTPEVFVIFINPSMGFGTGHHASTRLCLHLLQQIPLAGASVLDVGTGSGILAIAARRLGAGVVAAIDPDPDALQSARENCETNNEQATIDLRDVELGRAAAELGRAFDIVLANLTGALIARHARGLADLTREGGRVIASGFQIYEADDVAGALEDVRLRVTHRIEEEDWVGLVASARPERSRRAYQPHTVHSALSATTGTVSARSVRGPRCSSCAPCATARSTSSSTQPPSGPMRSRRGGRRPGVGSSKGSSTRFPAPRT